jgi:hypothetical protein
MGAPHKRNSPTPARPSTRQARVRFASQQLTRFSPLTLSRGCVAASGRPWSSTIRWPLFAARRVPRALGPLPDPQRVACHPAGVVPHRAVVGIARVHRCRGGHAARLGGHGSVNTRVNQRALLSSNNNFSTEGSGLSERSLIASVLSVR